MKAISEGKNITWVLLVSFIIEKPKQDMIFFNIKWGICRKKILNCITIGSSWQKLTYWSKEPEEVKPP